MYFSSNDSSYTSSMKNTASGVKQIAVIQTLLHNRFLGDDCVLIMDEPTRNFSPLSGPQVRRILKQFPGAILSVSHDRKFIAEVCDKVYSLTDKGLTEFEKEKL